MKKLLPPIMFIVFVIIMALISWVSGSLHNISGYQNLIGLPFLIAGLGLAASGKRLFKKLNTNIMTFGEPDQLVTEGVYQYTRNPMYLGFVIALFGVALLLGSAMVSLLLVVVFVVITDRWYIAFEERMMLKKFGPAYEVYCQKVRRWI